jgi:hypothetical protein
MTSTRRLALQPMATKALGDAILLRLEAGTSDSPSRRFHAGRPVPAFTIGTGADWRIDAPGVAPIHAYLKFDGHALSVATADPDDPVLVDGRPVPETWLALAAPCTLAMGGARLAIDSRISSEFPAALPPAPIHADVATRIDIQPLWANQDEKFEAAARELTRTAFEPSATTEVAPSASDAISDARPGRARPTKAIVLLVAATLVSLAAYRWIVPRLGSPEPAAGRVEAPPISPPERATAPATPPIAAAPVAAAPVAVAPASPPSATSPTKTMEREAVDALTAGDFAKASKLYRALAEAHPNQHAFKEALRILEERSRPH